MNKRMFKPEIEYTVKPNITFDEIKQAYVSQETITGKVVSCNNSNRTLVVDLGNNIKGLLPWNDATIYQFKKSKVDDNIPEQILSLQNKKIRVKVKSINPSHIILSRKRNMLEAWKEIFSNSETSIYNAVIVGMYKYGVFYDVGEGLIAFSHIKDLTAVIVDVETWFRIGERHLVELTNIDQENNYCLECSRKKVYKDHLNYDTYKAFQIVDVKLGKPVHDENNNLTGFFVEINPAVIGIADLPYIKRELRTGDIMQAAIKIVNVEEAKIKLELL